MKITEIEFGVTVNLGNYETSKLSLKVELEDGENPEETLAQLKDKVVELAGGDTQLMRRVASKDRTRESVKKIKEVQREYEAKEAELNEWRQKLSDTKWKISKASELLDKLDGLELPSSTLETLQKVVRTYEQVTDPSYTPEFKSPDDVF